MHFIVYTLGVDAFFFLFLLLHNVMRSYRIYINLICCSHYLQLSSDMQSWLFRFGFLFRPPPLLLFLLFFFDYYSVFFSLMLHVSLALLFLCIALRVWGLMSLSAIAVYPQDDSRAIKLFGDPISYLVSFTPFKGLCGYLSHPRAWSTILAHGRSREKQVWRMINTASIK